MFVLTISTTSFLLGLTMGGTLFPWGSGSILLPLFFGAAGWAVFVFLEQRPMMRPMIPLQILKDRSVAAGYFSTFTHGLVLWSVAYNLIIFVGLTPIGS
jgi:hypothetical protein